MPANHRPFWPTTILAFLLGISVATIGFLLLRNDHVDSPSKAVVSDALESTGEGLPPVGISGVRKPPAPSTPRRAIRGVTQFAVVSNETGQVFTEIAEHDASVPRTAAAPRVFAAAPRAPIAIRTRGGSIVGRVTLVGTPPPEKPLPMDAACGRLHQTPPTTRFYIVDSEGGLADAFVQIQAGLKSKRYAPPAEPVVLNQAGCLFEPYVFGLQTGQKLLIRNSDPILHNIHVIPSQDSGNPESNRAQTAGASDAQYIFKRPDRSMRIKCDVHPWMFAYVTVVEHPFFAVTGADGRYEINNVPPGTYDIEISHRKAGVAVNQVTVKDGEPATLDVELAVP